MNPHFPIIQSTRNSSRNSDILHRNCTMQATPHNLEVQKQGSTYAKLLNEVPIWLFFTHTVILINMKNTFLDWFKQFWVMYYLEIQGLFKDFCHNSRSFQGFMQIQGLFKTSSQIKGLFNTVRTLYDFYCLFKICILVYGTTIHSPRNQTEPI